jgi:tripartite-type tricarboxylate transporter receptor subunit TctC
MAPSGTPRPVVDKLNHLITRILGANDVRERFSALAVEPRTTTPEQFRTLLESDLKRWAKVVKDAGIKAN